MTARLGWDPPPITVNVAVGGTFDATLVAATPLNAGDVIDLYFTGTGAAITWPATANGDFTRYVWAKTVAQVATLIAADNRAVVLRYTPSGGETSIRYRGTVHVN